MSENKSTKKVPLHIVYMTIGLICIFTAGAIFLVMPNGRSRQQNPQTSGSSSTGPANALPAATVSPGAPALMPETPADTAGQPGNLVNAQEAAMPYSGQPTHIEIPAIDLAAGVVPVGLQQVTINGSQYFQWQVPADFLAGWHNTSANLGQPGNTVLNGHHNIFGEVFGRLIDLNTGDVIMMRDNRDEAFYYTISQVEILPERGESLEVRITNASWINTTQDERLTLVTCWPPDDNSHRLIIVAHPQEDSPVGTEDGSTSPES